MATDYAWAVDKETKNILVAWAGEMFWMPNTPLEQYRNNPKVILFLKKGGDHGRYRVCIGEKAVGWNVTESPLVVPKEILMKELIGALEWQPST